MRGAAETPAAVTSTVTSLFAPALTPWASAVWLLFFLYVFYFFRDPERVTPTDPDIVVAAADGLVAFYLLGPAASITVTPTHVIVDNPYVHHEISRTAIAGPAAEGFWFQRLPLRTGGAVRLVALSLNLPRNYPDQLGRHDHRSLPALMARVPQQDSNAKTRSAPRLLPIALATLAVAAPLTWWLAATR